MVKIGIIVGSTRPGRFAGQPANWIKALADERATDEVTFELIDVEDAHLPLLDEPMPPMMHQYSKDHTKAWADRIEGCDGFIVVTAEYNHSVPGALKNAFDYLNHEWRYKPVSFVSYGSAAGGARAVEHLRGIAGELHMYDLREQVLISNYWNNLNEQGEYQFGEEESKQAAALFDENIFWTMALKSAREEYLKQQ